MTISNWSNKTFLYLTLLSGMAFPSAGYSQFYSCQASFQQAQALTFSGGQPGKSIASKIDRIQDVAQDMDRSVRNLQNIANTNVHIDQAISVLNSTLDYGMVQQIQYAYNSNVNTQQILIQALQKYEAALNQKGLADVASHIRSALQMAQAADKGLHGPQGAENGANLVKQKLFDVQKDVKASAQIISASVGETAQRLNRSADSIKWMTERLVGKNYWGRHSVDPNSDLGVLENVMRDLQARSCVK